MFISISMKNEFSFSDLVKKRIHIAPVGFEYSRIIEPLLLSKADKIWLLRHIPDKGPTQAYLEKIKRTLKQKNIPFEIKETNLFNMIEILNSAKEIIEIESKNDIFVNISSGSKIAAVALSLACMLWEGQPYYVMAKEYPTHLEGKTISEGIEDIISVPKFRIISPDIEHIDVLAIIKKHGGSMKKKDLIEELIKIDQIKENISDQGKYNILNRKFLTPLFKEKDIEIVENNHEVKITKEGKLKLRIFHKNI